MPDNFSIYPHVGRKTPAKGNRFTLAGPNILWATICTDKRQPWLTQESVFASLQQLWLADDNTWLVGDFLFMPDHLHFFCAPYKIDVPFERWVGFWKTRFSNSSEDQTWRWQPGVFHHRIRSASEYTNKWNYMLENPLRKGLSKNIDDWPWKGRIHTLNWT